MNELFRNLFELVYLNSYYESGRSVNFRTWISNESRNLIKRYRLHSVELNAGELVLFNEKSPLLGSSQGWKSNKLKLSFFLKNNDINFYNFTQLPETTNFFYYSNKFLDKAPGFLKEFYLNLRPFVFDQTLTENQRNKSYRIIDDYGDVILGGTTPDESSFQINLEGYAKERYRLIIEDLLVLDFYIYTDIQQPFFGVVDIFLDEIQISNDQPKTLYNLNFNARKTYWEYIVSYPKTKEYQFSICKVVEKQGSYTYKPTDEFCRNSAVKDDKEVIIFTSKLEFPFEERPRGNIFALRIFIIEEAAQCISDSSKCKCECDCCSSGCEDSQKEKCKQIIDYIVLPAPGVQLLGARRENPCNQQIGIISKCFINI